MLYAWWLFWSTYTEAYNAQIEKGSDFIVTAACHRTLLSHKSFIWIIISVAMRICLIGRWCHFQCWHFPCIFFGKFYIHYCYCYNCNIWWMLIWIGLFTLDSYILSGCFFVVVVVFKPLSGREGVTWWMMLNICLGIKTDWFSSGGAPRRERTRVDKLSACIWAMICSVNDTCKYSILLASL